MSFITPTPPPVHLTPIATSWGNGVIANLNFHNNIVGKVHSPFNYGAVGNGIADDTAAIQAAINAATAGQSVYLPPATYMTTATINVPNNSILIHGDPLYTSIIAPANLSFDAIQIGNGTTGYGNYVSVRDITIQPLAQTGGSGGVNGTRAFNLNNAQNVYFKDVEITGTYNGLFINSGGVFMRDVHYRPADLTDTGRYGFQVTGIPPGNGNACILEHCGVWELANTNQNMIDAFVQTYKYAGLTLINCAAEVCNHGFWSKADAGQSPNYLIMQTCTAESCNASIQLDYGYNAWINSFLTDSNKIPSGTPQNSGAITVSSTWATNPNGNGTIWLQSPQVGPGNGGITIVGSSNTVVNISNPNVWNIGPSTPNGPPYWHALELNGGATVFSTGGRYGNTLGSNVANAINLDTGFTGLFNMNGGRVDQTNWGLSVVANSAGTFQLVGVNFGSTNFPYNMPATYSAAIGSRITACSVNGIGKLPATGIGISVPNIASGTAIPNPFPFDCAVYVIGASVTGVTVTGAQGGASNNLVTATFAQGLFIVPVHGSITLTYSGSPSWQWVGL